jgi:hypothetical protein
MPLPEPEAEKTSAPTLPPLTEQVSWAAVVVVVVVVVVVWRLSTKDWLGSKDWRCGGLIASGVWRVVSERSWNFPIFIFIFILFSPPSCRQGSFADLAFFGWRLKAMVQ